MFELDLIEPVSQCRGGFWGKNEKNSTCCFMWGGAVYLGGSLPGDGADGFLGGNMGVMSVPRKTRTA